MNSSKSAKADKKWIKILNKCINIFERTSLPTILPNPIKYAKLTPHQKERNRMIQAGLNTTFKGHSDLGQSILLGNYELFLILIKVRNIVNLNTYFEGESRWSLMHFAMFGRKQIVASNPSITFQILNRDPNFKHIKIAQYLINNGLYIDIQSKWGYTALHESLINNPDLYFAQFLLNNDANPNVKNIFGEPLLYSAVTGSYIESVKLACEYGADPRIECGFNGHNALYFGRLHYKILAILNNTKRKLERSELSKLECENIGFCSVCNVSSKRKKLYQCSKCRDYNIRYCSVACQKIDYKIHAINCKKNKRKISMTSNTNTNRNDKELIFNVVSAQNEMLRRDPLQICNGMAHEMVSKHFKENVGNLPTDMETIKKDARKLHLKTMKKIKKRMKKHMRTKRGCKSNTIVVNEKFILKVQTPGADSGNSLQNKILVYNKGRKYMVFIERNKQKQKFNTLSNIVKQYSPKDDGTGCKAYLYGWIDAKHKLHILIDKVLALQHW
eukprot:270037_1